MVDRGCGGGGGEGLAWADGRWSAGLSSLQGGGGLPAGHTYRGKPEKGVLVGGSPGHQGPGPQLHRVRCRKALSASTPREMMDSRCLSGLPATLCAHRPVSSSVYRRVYVYAFRELLVSMERKRERCRTYLLLLLVHLLPPPSPPSKPSSCPLEFLASQGKRGCERGQPPILPLFFVLSIYPFICSFNSRILWKG